MDKQRDNNWTIGFFILLLIIYAIADTKQHSNQTRVIEDLKHRVFMLEQYK